MEHMAMTLWSKITQKRSTLVGTSARRAGCLGAAALIRLALGGVLLGGPFTALPAHANPFETVITVNDRAITQYELDQRLLFLTILRQQGDLPDMARKTLIEDRLRMDAAQTAGIKITPEQVMAGMTEFAGRANLTAEQFVTATGQMGLDPESFRDFVSAGMIWREVVRSKFAGQITITNAEIDRAIANYQPTSAVRLSVLELSLPAEGAKRSGAIALARRLQSQIVTEADFAAAVREHGGTGRNWRRLSEMPEPARIALGRQAPGTMTAPLPIDDKLVIYWLAERGEEPLGKDAGVFVDYAQFLIPAGPNAEAELSALRARVDTCDDLYGVAKGLPADRLLRETQSQTAVGGDIGAVLATLDTGESSTRISRAGWRVFLMLCSRGPAKAVVPDRASISEQLLNQRLGSLAEIHLEKLRSEAIIIEK